LAVENEILPVLSTSAIRKSLSLSREKMSVLLRVSAKTITRWESEGQRPSKPDHLHRLAKLKEIIEIGRRVYTPEGLKAFLSTPMPVFDGRTGFDLIFSGEYEKVIRALAADYEGAGF
jgi:transcriptional regulator with XRE-family HTH domain